MRLVWLGFIVLLLVPGFTVRAQDRYDFQTDKEVVDALDRLRMLPRTRIATLMRINQLLLSQDSVRQSASSLGLYYYLQSLAESNLIANRPEDALRYGGEALSLAERINSHELIFKSAVLLTQISGDQKMVDEVDYYLSVANAAAEASRKKELRYEITIQESQILFAKNEMEKLRDLLRGYKLMTVNDSKDSLFRAELLFFDGLARMELERDASDPDEFRIALDFLGTRDDSRTNYLRNRIFGSLGNFAIAREEYAKAVVYFQDLLSWSVARQDIEQQIYVNYYLGKAYYLQESHAKAEDFFKISLALADSMRLTMWQERNLTELIYLTYRDARPYESIKYLERRVALSDSLRDDISKQQYIEAQALYDLNRKQTQIQTLQESNQRQSVMQYALVAGILLLVVILVLIVRLNMQHRRTNLLLERKNEEIDRQKQKLEELNETKNRLFSIIGHDLRGPVGNIRTFLEMLESAKEDLSAKEYHEIIETAKRSAASTYTLLNTLLDWGAHQMGTVAVTMEPVRPLDIVQQAELFLMGISRIKNVRITKQIDPDTTMLADKNIISTVVRNLLANAIKYTPENGRIHITTKKNEQTCVLTISDTGVGIPAEIKEKLFREKVASRAGTGNEAGSGLGLFVCKSLVDELGGKIWLESEVNIGTTVYVELRCV